MLRNHTVLAVDDDAKTLRSLRRVFADHRRISLVACEDPMKALRIATDEEIDLVIVDQQMPSMTGTELLGRLVERKPEILSIVLTGYSDVEVILKAINDLGVYKFILKPWKNEDLYWTVVRALEMKEAVENNSRLRRELREREACLTRLEHRYPGISKVERDKSGAVVIDDS